MRNDGFRFIPVKVALHPHIGEPDDENEQEYRHFYKSKKPQLTKDQGPREEEHDLHVEDEEDQSDDVKANVEPDPCVSDGFFAAFIRFEFLGIRTVRTKNPGCDEPPGNEHSSEDEEDEDFSEFCEHARI